MPVLQDDIPFAAYLQQAREYVHRATAPEETMTLQSVLDQYAKHIIRINHRAHAMKSHLNHGERKAIAYYTAAANAVQTMIDQPTAVAQDSGLKFHRL